MTKLFSHLSFLVLATGAVGVYSPPALSQSQTCSADSVATCAQLRAAPLNAAGHAGFPASQTGDVVFNALAYTNMMNDVTSGRLSQEQAHTRMIALAEPSPAQMRRADELTEMLRREAIAMIAGDTRRELHTPEQRALIQRLETVRFAAYTNDHEACWSKAPIGFPNAVYDSNIHTIAFCPAAMKQNPAYFISLVGHELAHVVDPCTATSTLYRVNREKATAGNASTCSPDLAGYENDIEGMSSSAALETDDIITTGASYTNGSRTSDRMLAYERCQIATPVNDSQVSQSEMFATTVSCLVQKTRSTYDAYTRNYVDAREMALGSREAAARAIESEMPRFCLGSTQEEFADGFSAKLTGKIARLQNWKPTDVRAATLWNRGGACTEEGGDLVNDPAEYPTSGNRLNTFLNDPDIATVLGCAPVSASSVTPKLCPVSIDPPRSTTSSPRNTPRRSAPARSSPTRSAQ